MEITEKINNFDHHQNHGNLRKQGSFLVIHSTQDLDNPPKPQEVDIDSEKIIEIVADIESIKHTTFQLKDEINQLRNINKGADSPFGDRFLSPVDKLKSYEEMISKQRRMDNEFKDQVEEKVRGLEKQLNRFALEKTGILDKKRLASQKEKIGKLEGSLSAMRSTISEVAKTCTELQLQIKVSSDSHHQNIQQLTNKLTEIPVYSDDITALKTQTIQLSLRQDVFDDRVDRVEQSLAIIAESITSLKENLKHNKDNVVLMDVKAMQAEQQGELALLASKINNVKNLPFFESSDLKLRGMNDKINKCVSKIRDLELGNKELIKLNKGISEKFLKQQQSMEQETLRLAQEVPLLFAKAEVLGNEVLMIKKKVSESYVLNKKVGELNTAELWESKVPQLAPHREMKKIKEELQKSEQKWMQEVQQRIQTENLILREELEKSAGKLDKIKDEIGNCGNIVTGFCRWVECRLKNPDASNTEKMDSLELVAWFSGVIPIL